MTRVPGRALRLGLLERAASTGSAASVLPAGKISAPDLDLIQLTDDVDEIVGAHRRAPTRTGRRRTRRGAAATRRAAQRPRGSDAADAASASSARRRDRIDAALPRAGRRGRRARWPPRGHSLVSGGGRVSMMGAVARAARAGGAHTIGVIPRPLVALEVADDDADELVVVDTMRERKRIMDERADAFLALPGGSARSRSSSRSGRRRRSACTPSRSSCSTRTASTRRSGPTWTTLAGRGFVRPAALDALQRVTTVERRTRLPRSSRVGALAPRRRSCRPARHSGT